MLKYKKYGKVKDYTKEEVDYLRQNYLNKTHLEMAIFLNRTLNSVRNKCYDMGLKQI